MLNLTSLEDAKIDPHTIKLTSVRRSEVTFALSVSDINLLIEIAKDQYPKINEVLVDHGEVFLADRLSDIGYKVYWLYVHRRGTVINHPTSPTE